MLRRLATLSAVGAALLATVAGQAAASPVAVNDESYGVLGRVFPDPLGGCQTAQSPICSPAARGNVPAHQFIQWEEFLSGISYLNQKHSRYMEVWTLDGKLDALPARQVNGSPADLLEGAPADPLAGTAADVRPRAGSGLGADKFPGNSLNFLEFTPKPEYRSAGIPTPFLDRKKSDLVVVRVTDETVPDVNKKRYALSLSIHGIERAGLEGGTRAIEDLVSADATGLANQPVVPPAAKQGAPTFAEALDESIIYFTYPNPDGWRRGSYSEGGLFFQRYNGNGVDLNRDWPDIGFSFRPYSGLSEPESRALAAFFTQVRDNFGEFAAGDDLHGQPFADALSYTLMPHGRHDYAKDVRIRETSKTINRASTQALSWSPIIGASPSGCNGTPLGTACTRIVGQTWGTVYDTINYTTTGALGDWFDSSVGLNADGIDNEMSFSHLDKNITFDPHTEQLHVDGNKTLIYAHLAEMLTPTEAPFDAVGTKGYVPNERLVREERQAPVAPAGTSPQTDIENRPCTPDPAGAGGMVTCPLTVERDNDTYSGGMRVDVTVPNVQGISSGVHSLQIQCKGCDEHRGTTYTNPAAADDKWIVVQEDFNQSGLYAQAGLTAAVNHPQPMKADGTPVQWRAVVDTQTSPILTGGICGSGCPPPSPTPASHTPVATMNVDFTAGPASIDGGTEDANEQPPALTAYDVANTDFFADLNPHITGKRNKFHTVDPARVIAGEQSLGDLDTLALADNPLPGDHSAGERAAWFAKVREWVEGGGNLVLTDGALMALPELTNIASGAVAASTVYVGQVSFPSTAQATLDADPLTKGVAQPGARFNSGARRQTFEPTPLGFAIQNDAGANASFARQYAVNKAAWTALGGTTSATSASSAPGATADASRTTIGRVALGAGEIRIAGSLLPQPATWPAGVVQPDPIMRTFPLGLEPYAVTYTGYILARNLLDDSTPADHNRAPVASLTHSPARVLTGERVDFDASGSSDEDGTIENYAWDLDGDGTFETDTGTSPRASTAYAANGVHVVAVKVTDDEGKSGLAIDSVTVDNRPPTAAFSWSPQTPKKKKPAAFDASASRDPDGSVVRYLWDFDGNGTADAQSASPTASHSFAEAGSYTVRLTVVDDDGATASTTRTVSVTARG
jgi:PKD repeat protein